MSGRPLSRADVGLVAAGVFAAASGQVLLRVGATKLAGGSASSVLVSALSSPALLAGLCLYFLAALIWMLVLSRVALSIAYPLGASSYVLVSVAGWTMGEQLPPMRIAGLALIVFGIVLVGAGGRR